MPSCVAPLSSAFTHVLKVGGVIVVVVLDEEICRGCLGALEFLATARTIAFPVLTCTLSPRMAGSALTAGAGVGGGGGTSTTLSKVNLQGWSHWLWMSTRSLTYWAGTQYAS